MAAARAAKYLGLEGAGSPLAFVEAAERGLPVSRLESFSRTVAPGDALFKYRIVPKPTFARRKEARPARLSKAESERLIRLARVFAFAEEIWGSQAAAIAFLVAPHALLEGAAPLDLTLRSEEGGRVVEDVLGRLMAGVAV